MESRVDTAGDNQNAHVIISNYRHDRRADNAAYRHDRRADSLSHPTYQIWPTVEGNFYLHRGGFRGGSGGSLEPPSGTKLFQFHGEIYEKSGKMLKRTPS